MHRRAWFRASVVLLLLALTAVPAFAAGKPPRGPKDLKDDKDIKDPGQRRSNSPAGACGRISSPG